MKYLCISESIPEELEKMIKWDSTLKAEREQNPGKYPRKIGDEYFIQGSLPRSTETPYHVMLALTIYEADDPEQMANLEARLNGIRVEDWEKMDHAHHRSGFSLREDERA